MTRETLRTATLTEETALVRKLVGAAGLDAAARARIAAAGADLVAQVRATGRIGMMESFLAEYDLSTDEGVALMCLAEAMLRVPDSETVDALIRDKITPHDWASHIGDSGSILVNASTWGLLLTGRVLDDTSQGVVGTLRGLVRRLGEPVIREAVARGMAEMGEQFVLGRDIAEAMRNGRKRRDAGYTYSYDMLGEAARTDADALRYHSAYAEAIAAIAARAEGDDVAANPGISVKLSALHPRYEQGQRETMLPVLCERLLSLAEAAAAANIGFNIDAEEADRLDLSLDVIERVLSADTLKGWDGFGVVVQAFGRRCTPVIDWLYALATRLDRRIMVRLVKGAYWDTEIKRAQVLALDDYPVFTRKPHTDISYLAASRQLLGMGDRIYPQFATHNAHSVAAVLDMAGPGVAYEFQRLHGMGEQLYDVVRSTQDVRCRIYAPVGAHEDLLAYLVRRILENGANSSFVNQIVDDTVPPEAIAADPIAAADAQGFQPNPAIPRPADLYYPRVNSQGWDITDPAVLAAYNQARTAFLAPHQWQAGPITPAGEGGAPRPHTSPYDPSDIVGQVREADAALVTKAVEVARAAQPDWAATPARQRAVTLRRAADLYEANAVEIFTLLAREAGKTLLDGVAELREAVDFLRYYADEAERLDPARAPRGVIGCISPWNFPLAIFTGQIAAALAAGNAVIAKPAEQTPLIAQCAVTWLLDAGVPPGALQLLPGDGAGVGAPLTAHPSIAGVAFTGSTEVAKIIDRQLAQTAPHAMLIAETGGLNAMVVDSTALPEQATRDIIRAAFQSAGQRCSALRVLLVQNDVKPALMDMLQGAMDTLHMGDPLDIATDVGPVIDAEARDAIQSYIDAHRQAVLKTADTPPHGLFIAPTLIEVPGIEAVTREIFGPVLHVAGYEAEALYPTIDAVNATGYGLTFGLHTRIDRRVQRVLDRVAAGNVYVNRDQIGAIVESQPFGGHGASGTGPKAGGPHYVARFTRAAHPPAAVRVTPAVATPKLSDAADLARAGQGDWAARSDKIATLRRALRGRAGPAMSAAAAVDAGPVDLPGPTGELNQLQLLAQGLVLCLGPTADLALCQAVQALAFGNGVVMVAHGAVAAAKPLVAAGLPLVALDGCITPGDLTALNVDLVAACFTPDFTPGGEVAIRRALAARDGPILPLVNEPISPAAYTKERTICIDTTAAGGNASLMAEAEGPDRA
ncbi:MAG: bifunctional proline dehydrogenase/L-glutamate gamma-semialdehyde dehydrogenase PutA [Pseudomonadota bacterium]